ncbi:MAG: hypothetical protein IPF60_12960 [Betaproteobacteria bacterium]|nr:hypothetical protein [Betaproteobacteria bacterium]
MEHRRENHQRIGSELVVQLPQTPAQVVPVATEVGPATMDRIAGWRKPATAAGLDRGGPEPPALRVMALCERWNN